MFAMLPVKVIVISLVPSPAPEVNVRPVVCEREKTPWVTVRVMESGSG